MNIINQNVPRRYAVDSRLRGNDSFSDHGVCDAFIFARKLIEWATLHQTELLQNWELARQNMPLEKIIPLE